MRISIKRFWLLRLILLTVTFTSQAQSVVGVVAVENLNNLNHKLLPTVSSLAINSKIVALHAQLKQQPTNTEKLNSILAQVNLIKINTIMPLNAAEQYLVFVAQALIKEKIANNSTDNQLSIEVIALLAQAAKLSVSISEQQLSQPIFLQLHLLLAKHYARQGKFDLAYLEKENYLKKYNTYRKNKRLAMIASLEQSFEVKDKKANNALLVSQNKLKVRRVAEAKDQKHSQQYNFTLIITTTFIFILLFFRQLRVRNRLMLLTRTDTLTGLANRNSLFENGAKMIAKFKEQPQEFSVLLLDLDHFKKINDHFGYQVGDEILKVVSQMVKETMRSRDVFYRLGGEEFVALLPFADKNKAKAIAVRINEKISQHDFSLLMMRGKVTVSIGVATMEHNEKSFDDMLHKADLAMYQAKDQGRNSVVCYQKIA